MFCDMQNTLPPIYELKVCTLFNEGNRITNRPFRKVHCSIWVSGEITLLTFGLQR